MADAAFAGRQIAGAYRGLRGWIDTVDRLGELKRVSGAHWDVEMGAVTHMLTEKSGGTAPAILFDDVPGYRKGFRTLYGQLSSVNRRKRSQWRDSRAENALRSRLMLPRRRRLRQ
jgi:3-polyprenyl-4-hydroxybenzoate decarboxylase